MADNEDKKIVFRVSKSMWKERSLKNKEDDKEAAREKKGDGNEENSPSPRRRSIPSKEVAFDPSGCHKCGTGTTCNNCLKKSNSSSSSIPLVGRNKEGESKSTSRKLKPLHNVVGKPTKSKSPKSKTNELTLSAMGGRKRSLSESSSSTEAFLRDLAWMKERLTLEQLEERVKSVSSEVFLSVINTMSCDNILKHLTSLRTEYIQKLLRPAIQVLMTHPRNSEIFNHPVDVIALGLKDYFEKIPKPMDLGTVKSQLLQGFYGSVSRCTDDVKLVFRNAMTYNPALHPVHQAALHLCNIFEEDIKSIEDRLEKDEERKSQHYCEFCQGNVCAFCGEKCLRLEPPILVCHGPCGQRIKRSGIYFVSSDGNALYCQKCHSSSGPVVSGSETPTSGNSPDGKNCSSNNPFSPVSGDYCTEGNNTPKPILKKDMLKRRFDEEYFEPWISCATCFRRVHQVCALYNPFHDGSDIGANDSNEEQPDLSGSKMVTRNRGRHDYGAYLHVSKHRSRALSVTSNSENIVDNSFRCAMCKLNSAIKKVKRCGRSFEENIEPAENSSASSKKRKYSIETNLDGNYVTRPAPSEINNISISQDNRVENGENTEVPSTSLDGNKFSVDEARTSPLPPSDVIHDTKELKHSESRNSEEGNPCDLGDKPTIHWKASSLPRCRLSDFIEAMVRDALNKCDMSERDDLCRSLTIRVVSNANRSMDVPDIISDNLPTNEGKRVPPYFVYRQKCILLFQAIDGIDVCLFCLYVQEFDENCPEPNKSRVYIAYLDSVEYFRPRQYRTLVYHEILIAYLKWAQVRGFKHGHIWACPPQRGDNFIFWCHPTQQRTPSRDRLNSWYNSMLSRAKSLGICSSVDNLWTAFFRMYNKRDNSLQRQASKKSKSGKSYQSKKSSKPSSSKACSEEPSPSENIGLGNTVPTCPPIFEGDFWVTECSRVFRLVQSRTQGVRYDKDKTFNQRKCREMLKALMTKPSATAFNQPVDPVRLKIPDYHLVIKNPMDLGTVRNNLRSNMYRSMLDFANDVRLTFSNAMTYNPPGHFIHTLAQQIRNDFEQMLEELVSDRIGDIATKATEVESWLATYPVNSAMEKEEKLKRQEGQEQQRERNFQTNFGGTKVNVNGFGADDGESSVAPASVSSLKDERSQSRRNTVCETKHVLFLGHSDSGGDKNGGASSAVDFEASEYGLVDYENEEYNMDGSARGISGSEGNESVGSSTQASCNDDESMRDYSRMEFQLSRQDSVESVASVCSVSERWPRRLDRTTSICVEESMDVSSGSNNEDLRIDIAATQEVSNKGTRRGFSRSNSVNMNLPFDKPLLGVKGSQAFMSELSRNVCRLKDDMYVLTFAPLTSSTCGDISEDSFLPSISSDCLDMLAGINPDTSDPDPKIRSPFIESRQTFLEMCQYRHFQFDCLRRAKHSSSLLIYHLLFPAFDSTRPRCHECARQIKHVRWHCSNCRIFPEYDICNSCKNSPDREPHQHEDSLTPIRVTYV